MLQQEQDQLKPIRDYAGTVKSLYFGGQFKNFATVCRIAQNIEAFQSKIGELQQMNDQILTSSQLLRRKDLLGHKQDLLKTLLGTGNAIPLDNSGFYMLVRKQYYDKILGTLQDGKKIKEDFERECHHLTMANAKANKQLLLLKSQITKFKQNQAKFQQHFQYLKNKLREAEVVIIELNQQLKISQFQPKIKQTIQRPQNIYKNVQTKSISSQTLYQPIQRQLSSIHQENPRLPEEIISIEETKLYELLQDRLNDYTSMFQLKIHQLQKCEFQLQAWEKQKQKLFLENEELRNKVKNIEVEQEKARIWNQNITKLRENIEENIRQTQIHQINERSGDRCQEATLLRGKLAQFRLQLRTVDEQMHSEEEIGDQGAVVNLVKLTQRIKTIVRSLLVEASMPE